MSDIGAERPHTPHGNGPQRERLRALVAGITGQDGSYLAELLLRKGYQVHGIVRRSSTKSTQRIDHLLDDSTHASRLIVHNADLLDPASLMRVMMSVKPHEVYNLAAQSHVGVSFEQPLYTAQVVALGTLNLLEAVRQFQAHDGAAPRFYQGSSSEMFGDSEEVPQSEHTPFRPRSPYAAAKVHAHWLTINYRESYGIHASCGILFNHESPRRSPEFVTRKITRAVAAIQAGLQEKLYLGNLEAHRDWGYAGDYVEAIWRMLQQREPDDYVVATGRTHSVREFCERAFACVGLDYHEYVISDPRCLRPADVERLQGDATKARRQLGWKPRVGLDQLVRMMVEADARQVERERRLGMSAAGIPGGPS